MTGPVRKRSERRREREGERETHTDRHVVVLGVVVVES